MVFGEPVHGFRYRVLGPLIRAIEICAVDAREGSSFRVFSDSQATIRRLMDDRPGPGQSLASRAIKIARDGIYARQAQIRICWAPGHSGVPDIEIADSWTVEEALRAERLEKGSRKRERRMQGEQVEGKS